MPTPNSDPDTQPGDQGRDLDTAQGSEAGCQGRGAWSLSYHVQEQGEGQEHRRGQFGHGDEGVLEHRHLSHEQAQQKGPAGSRPVWEQVLTQPRAQVGGVHADRHAQGARAEQSSASSQAKCQARQGLVPHVGDPRVELKAPDLHKAAGIVLQRVVLRARPTDGGQGQQNRPEPSLRRVRERCARR